MERHQIPFFGQKSGFIFDSGTWNIPAFYIRFLRKKDNGVWEKPTQKEGKSIKFNLLELVEILYVLRTKGAIWQTVHRFGQDQTSIKWEHQNDGLIISIPGYFRKLGTAEIRLFGDLMEHVYREKIEHATDGSSGNSENKGGFPTKKMNFSQEINGDNQNFTKRKYDPNIDNGNGIFSTKNPKNRQMLNNTKALISLDDEINQDDQNAHSHNQIEVKYAKGKSSDSVFSDLDQNSKDSEQWLRGLTTKDDLYLVPGNIEAKSQRAIAFRIPGKNSMWIPLSCIEEMETIADESGLWIKKWFLEKKLDSIFA